MHLCCLNQSELNLKLTVEACNHGVTRGTPAVSTGLGRRNDTRRMSIGFSGNSFISNIDVARDSLFLEAIPFLTLPYLLI